MIIPTCTISNLNITKDAVAFVLVERPVRDNYFHTTAINKLCPIPIYGEYKDGGLVKCKGLYEIIVDEIKQDLISQPENISLNHIAICSEKFDIDTLFKAVKQNQLYINEFVGFQTKPVKINIALIHNDIFNDIINGFYMDKYTDDKAEHIYFYEIIKDIPNYIEVIKNLTEQENKDLVSSLGDYSDILFINNKVHEFIKPVFDRGDDFELISPLWGIIKFVTEEDYENLSVFLYAIITGLWIDEFMSYTRKYWMIQNNASCDNCDSGAYKILANSILETVEKGIYLE
jgi:hypothetical protein